MPIIGLVCIPIPQGPQGAAGRIGMMGAIGAIPPQGPHGAGMIVTGGGQTGPHGLQTGIGGAQIGPGGRYDKGTRPQRQRPPASAVMGRAEAKTSPAIWIFFST